MSGNQTEVFQLDGPAGRRLGDALTRDGYLFKTPAHARFQAQGDGVTATLYNSGKLVVQGRAIEGWVLRYLGAARRAQPKSKDAALPPPDRASLGADEAGKGDTFGPLVLCAVAWPEGGDERLLEWGVTDSKRLSDERVRLLAPRIRERLEHAERAVFPREYNEAHRAAGDNLNRLMARLHAGLLGELLDRSGVKLAIVDAFSPRKPVSAKLADTHPGATVLEVPRAERHPAVAAASILARERFLGGLAELEAEWAVDLPKGSGAPVGPALRRFLEIHGPEPLASVAKLHFRNVAAALEAYARKR